MLTSGAETTTPQDNQEQWIVSRETSILGLTGWQSLTHGENSIPAARKQILPFLRWLALDLEVEVLYQDFMRSKIQVEHPDASCISLRIRQAEKLKYNVTSRPLYSSQFQKAVSLLRLISMQEELASSRSQSHEGALLPSYVLHYMSAYWVDKRDLSLGYRYDTMPHLSSSFNEDCVLHIQLKLQSLKNGVTLELSQCECTQLWDWCHRLPCLQLSSTPFQFWCQSLHGAAPSLIPWLLLNTFAASTRSHEGNQ